MSNRTKALLAIVTASILWGTAGVSAKLLVQVLNPFVAAFYRFLIASLCILPFFLRAKKPRGYLRHLLPMSLLSAANIVLFYLGIKTTTANATTLLYAGTPLATALFAKILIKEDVTRKKFIGVFIGLIGVVLIVLLPVLEKQSRLTGDLRGNVLIIFAVLSWTLYTVGSRHYSSSKTYTPLLMTAMNFFTTCIVALLFGLATRQQFFPPSMFTLQYLTMLFYAGIFITLITYGLFQWAIQYLSATTASLKNYLEPVVGVSLNSLLLGEQITAGFILGSILVITGVTITTSNKLIYQINRGLKKLTG